MANATLPGNLGILCVAHGTIEDLAEIPDFLKVIRRGRPPSPALIHELTERYRRIGGSPLNAVTARQAQALGQRLGIPALWGMRLWKPWVADVLKEQTETLTSICVLPLAPFSVQIYCDAAEEALSSVLQGAPGPTLFRVEPWGSQPGYVNWFATRIQESLAKSAESTQVILTAHSLPTRAIQAGDRYQLEVSACALAVSAALARPTELAYQSQGADGGDWLGPDLKAALKQAAASGFKRVIVAPIGFVSEHVETLYDLDIEAAGWAKEFGLGWERVAAPNDDPAFIQVLEHVARAAIKRNASL